MVVLTSFQPPEDGVRHKQDNTRALVCTRDMGNGSLFITESRVSWVGVNGQGFSLEYPHISLHAVSRDPSSHPDPCLYLMLDADVNEAEQNSSDSEDENEKMSEVRFVPADPQCCEFCVFALSCLTVSFAVDALYKAMSECQVLHPDPEQGEQSDDGWEGQGDGFFTAEDDLENLTPEGRARLEHLENILQQNNEQHANGADEDMDTSQFEDADNLE
ncbi:hypothetical protein CAPTEDRAFT_184496 [Capitella teleta]|uniref:Methylosome subunit pICln n=1 Tax=Capitella teleta TaxID=283909 RepID=R7U5I0_CAPTE|nr:hypothetical protein CAPTEDRAFT_184496 [Capitella teleta]|eukprot:ELT98946.1 hypothetical protein CAPTEDRAFT_184496 [Capitella teleta]